MVPPVPGLCGPSDFYYLSMAAAALTDTSSLIGFLGTMNLDTQWYSYVQRIPHRAWQYHPMYASINRINLGIAMNCCLFVPHYCVAIHPMNPMLMIPSDFLTSRTPSGNFFRASTSPYWAGVYPFDNPTGFHWFPMLGVMLRDGDYTNIFKEHQAPWPEGCSTNSSNCQEFIESPNQLGSS